MLWTSEASFSYDSIPAASSDFVIPSDDDYDKHRIRVLRVSRTQFLQKTPKCKLKTIGIQIGDPAPLECRALSYVHGSDERDKDIQVNGKRLRVSGNLYDCLEVLAKDGRRWGDLWVDQISINNASTPERSRQVKHMGEIYRQAKEVVVWLGKGLLSDSLAVDIILRTFETELQSGNKAELTSDALDLLRSFIRNPYFTRLWAVQELVLGRDIILLVGDRELTWNTMISVYSNHIFNPHPSSLRDIPDYCPSLQRISMARTQQSVLDIFDVVNGFCKYDCTDPRDHLFGLLGILNSREDGQRLCLTVDYSSSLEAVFFNFCYEMLETMPETEQLFDLLVMLAHSMGFDGVFYGGCAEDEVLEFFRGAGTTSRTDATNVRANVRNRLQSKTVQFQEAAVFLAMGVPAEYDMLSGKRIF